MSFDSRIHVRPQGGGGGGGGCCLLSDTSARGRGDAHVPSNTEYFKFF